MEKQEPIDWKTILFFIIMFVVLIFIIYYRAKLFESNPVDYKVTEKDCNKQIKGSSELYCYPQVLYGCNTTGWGCLTIIEYQVRNKTQERLDNERVELEKANQAKKEAQDRLCYVQGYNVNKSLDIMKDYNLSCAKLGYINDHFIDKVTKEDGGYIHGKSSGSVFGFGVGSSFGFVSGSSHGEINGQMYQYVATHVLATGQLARQVQFHVNCQENVSDINIDYYNEADFVMYYTNRCIK